MLKKQENMKHKIYNKVNLKVSNNNYYKIYNCIVNSKIRKYEIDWTDTLTEIFVDFLKLEL